MLYISSLLKKFKQWHITINRLYRKGLKHLQKEYTLNLYLERKIFEVFICIISSANNDKN